jgi:four helix bundle protein
MRDHKSLLAWQEAHAVVLALLHAIRQVKYAYSNPIFDQLQRAALSVQLNIAEGYALNLKAFP